MNGLVRFLFLITAIQITGNWLLDLCDKRHKPGEKTGDQLTGNEPNNDSQTTKQLPKSLYKAETKILWRIDMGLVLLMLLGWAILSGD